MKFEIIKEQTLIRSYEGEYHLDERFSLYPPERELYEKMVREMQRALREYPIETPFKNTSPISVCNDLDDPEDESCWLIVLEMSAPAGRSQKTIGYIWETVEKTDPRFSVYLTFGYNYLGIKFSCLIEKGIASFAFHDKESQAAFGL